MEISPGTFFNKVENVKCAAVGGNVRPGAAHGLCVIAFLSHLVPCFEPATGGMAHEAREVCVAVWLLATGRMVIGSSD